MKQMRGTLYLSACRQTVSDCGSTPATPSNTATAPSRTRKRALDFHRKINVTGRVNDVDAMLDVIARPEAGRRGGSNRNAALLFLFHPVHRRRSFVNFADFVRNAGVESTVRSSWLYPRQCAP
jgi:hypothetical protein